MSKITDKLTDLASSFSLLKTQIFHAQIFSHGDMAALPFPTKALLRAISVSCLLMDHHFYLYRKACQSYYIALPFRQPNGPITRDGACFPQSFTGVSFSLLKAPR